MKKILLVFVFAFCFFVLNVDPALADNDTLGVYCDVSVNGVALSPDEGGAPTIYASRKDGANFVYPIRVCGNLDLVTTLPAGASPVINMVPYRFNFFEGQPSERINLTKDGSCLVGEYSKNIAPNGGAIDSVYDVEGNNSGNTPLCHRVFARLAPSVVGDTDEWTNAFGMCNDVSLNPSAPIHNDDVRINFIIPPPFQPTIINSPEGISYTLKFKLIRSTDNNEMQNKTVSGLGGFGFVDNMEAGNYRAKFVLEGSNGNIDVCEKSFNVGTPNSPGGINSGVGATVEFKICNQAGLPGSDSYTACTKCFYDSQGVWTGIGCIPYSNSASTVRAFVTIGLGVAGTVVVLMTLAGSFLMTTSRGEPQRVDEAKSLITSAIAGIFFLIFSVSILQFIGVSIFRIPGFG